MDGFKYWLADRYCIGSGNTDYGLECVYYASFDKARLYYTTSSTHTASSPCYGVRPVIYLKGDVQLTKVEGLTKDKCAVYDMD